VAQATFTHGQSGEPGYDRLKIDLKNAYGTIRRSDILAGLREHAPRLSSDGSLISYGSPTQLFHAVHTAGVAFEDVLRSSNLAHRLAAADVLHLPSRQPQPRAPLFLPN
jgi:hypothetical protein